MALLLAVITIYASSSQSGFLMTGRLTVPLDVSLVTAPVAFSFLSEIVPQGLLLVAPSLFGSASTIQVISCI